MACTPLHLEAIKPGLRVQITTEKGHVRIGMLTGTRGDTHASFAEVIPEGCSGGTPERWPIAKTEVLSLFDQLRSMGGSFDPPKGYPYVKPPRS